MSQREVRGSIQIIDDSITREALNTTLSGSAVVTKLIPGTNVTFESTGVEEGTGIVTINTTASGAPGSSITWNSVNAASLTMEVNNGYIVVFSGQSVLTLPTTAALGDMLYVTGAGAISGWKIIENASEIIHFGDMDTATTSGYLESIDERDSITLVCVVANTEWNVISSIGNITVV